MGVPLLSVSSPVRESIGCSTVGATYTADALDESEASVGRRKDNGRRHHVPGGSAVLGYCPTHDAEDCGYGADEGGPHKLFELVAYFMGKKRTFDLMKREFGWKLNVGEMHILRI